MSDFNENSSVSLSPFEILVNIYTNPTRAFSAIKARPNWLLPVIISIILGLASVYLLRDISVEEQKQRILRSERITEEQKDMFLEEFESPGFMRQYGYGFLTVILSVFVIYALIGLAFMVTGNFIMGGETSFKMNFVLAAWGSQIGILESFIKIPLMLSKSSTKVYTSLAVFFDPSESDTVLFKLFDAVDIFAIWKIIVFAIGFSIIYKFSRGKSYAAIVSLYLIYTIFAVGLSQLFGSFV
jgi:hypothetical protein